MTSYSRRLTACFVAAACAAVVCGCSKNESNQNAAGGSATSAAAMSGMQGVAAGDAARGKQLYIQNCASCHGATGTEGGVGPTLAHERSRKNTAAAIAWIKNPQPPMPKLYPSPLSQRDVADIAAYVETL